ncbi:MAG: hypothetical protein K6E95_00225 [Lachnospiraceae bacterium]|nr:hypothetical protein [Lachnospiraceae bacterium]
MKLDLKSIVTLIVTSVLCVSFLGVVAATIFGIIEPSATIVVVITQTFTSIVMAVYAFYFSKKKDEKKEGPNEN